MSLSTCSDDGAKEEQTETRLSWTITNKPSNPPSTLRTNLSPLHTHSHTDADVHTRNNNTLMVISHFTSWHDSCPVRWIEMTTDLSVIQVFPRLNLIDGRRLLMHRVFLFRISQTLGSWGNFHFLPEDSAVWMFFCFFFSIKGQVLTPSHFNCPVHKYCCNSKWTLISAGITGEIKCL